MKKYILYSLLVLVASCNKNEPQTEPNYVEIFGISDFMEAQEKLGVYVNFGLWANGVIHLESVKSRVFNPTGDFIFNYSVGKGDYIDAGKLTLGDLVSEYDESKYVLNGYENATPEQLALVIDAQLGKEVVFKLERDNATVFESKLYLPPAIEVLDFTTSGQMEGSSSYLISRNNFQFTWPVDVNNENGILVVLTWGGDKTTTALGEPRNTDYEYRIAKINDTGSATLPTNFYDGIPKDAMVFMYFYRGNSDIFQTPDKLSYNIGVYNYEQIGMILED